jgi:beta-lactamase regulating signal transducer with metallopeptidase domain
MTLVQLLLSGSVPHALGLCLVHFVWQGLLVACGLACMLALMRRSSANTRYVVLFAGLLLMAAFPVVTMAMALSSARADATPSDPVTPPVRVFGGVAAHVGNSTPEAPVPAVGAPSVSPPFRLPHAGLWKARIIALLDPLLPWVASLWLAGVWLLGLWNLGGWLQAQRLRVGNVKDVPEPWIAKAKQICERLGVKHSVRLLESGRVATPMVVGLFRPLILLPAAVLTGLTPDQAHAVLAHELAHVRRYDYAANLLQTAIVTLLFYHPAVWWVSRRIRDERENCCDDLAVKACGDGLLYARVLAALAELRGAPAPSWTLAASGGILLRRVRHIVGAPEPRAHGWAPLLTGVCLLLAVFAALGFPSVNAQEPVVAGEKAELMGRVESFFLGNYRDITARKSLEWGDVEHHENGNRSIRYTFRATIWDKDKMMISEVYTFDPQGAFVSVEKVPGYPKKEEEKVRDITTKRGMMDLVEDFFSHNFRDITSRDTIEWGEVEKLPNGNASIRYKYNATIWDKEKKVMEQVFTFNPKGEYVSVEDLTSQVVRRSPDSFPDEKPDLTSPESVVVGFTKAAALGNAKLARAYFLPEGEDYDDIWKTLTAEPGQSEYAGRIMMQAVDPGAPMPILSKEGPDDRLKVIWRVTFAKGFEIEGKTFQTGSTYDFDATLRKTDKGWLIDNF